MIAKFSPQKYRSILLHDVRFCGNFATFRLPKMGLGRLPFCGESGGASGWKQGGESQKGTAGMSNLSALHLNRAETAASGKCGHPPSPPPRKPITTTSHPWRVHAHS